MTYFVYFVSFVCCYAIQEEGVVVAAASVRDYERNELDEEREHGHGLGREMHPGSRAVRSGNTQAGYNPLDNSADNPPKGAFFRPLQESSAPPEGYRLAAVAMRKTESNRPGERSRHGQSCSADAMISATYGHARDWQFSEEGGSMLLWAQPVPQPSDQFQDEPEGDTDQDELHQHFLHFLVDFLG